MGFRGRPRSNAEAIADAIGRGGEGIAAGIAQAGRTKLKVDEARRKAAQTKLSNELKKRQLEILEGKAAPLQMSSLQAGAGPNVKAALENFASGRTGPTPEGFQGAPPPPLEKISQQQLKGIVDVVRARKKPIAAQSPELARQFTEATNVPTTPGMTNQFLSRGIEAKQRNERLAEAFEASQGFKGRKEQRDITKLTLKEQRDVVSDARARRTEGRAQRGETRAQSALDLRRTVPPTIAQGIENGISVIERSAENAETVAGLPGGIGKLQSLKAGGDILLESLTGREASAKSVAFEELRALTDEQNVIQMFNRAGKQTTAKEIQIVLKNKPSVRDTPRQFMVKTRNQLKFLRDGLLEAARSAKARTPIGLEKSEARINEVFNKSIARVNKSLGSLKKVPTATAGAPAQAAPADSTPLNEAEKAELEALRKEAGQ